MSDLFFKIMTDLDEGIAAKMLAAMGRESDDSESDELDLPSIEEQKRYLMTYVNVVDLRDREALRDVVIRNNHKQLLQSCAEGRAINLRITPEHIITQMYTLLLYKMEKRNTAGL